MIASGGSQRFLGEKRGVQSMEKNTIRGKSCLIDYTILKERGDRMKISTSLCNRLARIIGGTGMVTNGACVVQRLRNNLNLKILGRRSRSPLTLPFALSVESKDSSGRTLNLGETVILEREINPFVSELRKRGIKVTAIHNHWLFQNICFKYIHWESIDNPVDFVRKSAAAARAVGILPKH